MRLIFFLSVSFAFVKLYKFCNKRKQWVNKMVVVVVVMMMMMMMMMKMMMMMMMIMMMTTMMMMVTVVVVTMMMTTMTMPYDKYYRPITDCFAEVLAKAAG